MLFYNPRSYNRRCHCCMFAVLLSCAILFHYSTRFVYERLDLLSLRLRYLLNTAAGGGDSTGPFCWWLLLVLVVMWSISSRL